MPRRALPAVARWVFVRREVTVRRAGIGIAAITLVVSLGSGLLMRLADPASFPSLGDGLWWAVQTVTTVGYGDIVPHTDAGKTVGVLVMLAGTAFVAVVTASITAGFIEIARRRLAGEGTLEDELREIREQLASIREQLGTRGS